MNCKETTRLICEYLEGRLGPGVEQEIHRHLGHCKNCRMILDAAQSTLSAYFNAEDEGIPAGKTRVA